jgi:hypothetical protein
MQETRLRQELEGNLHRRGGNLLGSREAVLAAIGFNPRAIQTEAPPFIGSHLTIVRETENSFDGALQTPIARQPDTILFGWK